MSGSKLCRKVEISSSHDIRTAQLEEFTNNNIFFPLSPSDILLAGKSGRVGE
jgi:hypothetical protein